MKLTSLLLLAALLAGVTGCASGYGYSEYQYPVSYPKYYGQYEPYGPGSVPPSWYYYDPAMRHWYEPWYTNPYQE